MVYTLSILHLIYEHINFIIGIINCVFILKNILNDNKILSKLLSNY